MIAASVFHLAIGFDDRPERASQRIPASLPTVRAAIARATWNDTLSQTAASDITLSLTENEALFAWALQDAQSGIAWLRSDPAIRPSDLRNYPLLEVRAGVSTASADPEPSLRYADICHSCGRGRVVPPTAVVAWNLDPEQYRAPFLFIGGDLLAVHQRLAAACAKHGVRLRNDQLHEEYLPVDAPLVSIDQATLQCSVEQCAQCGQPNALRSGPRRVPLANGQSAFDGSPMLRLRDSYTPDAGCAVSDVQIGEAEPHVHGYPRLLFLTPDFFAALQPLTEDLVVHPVERP